jgi:RNA polymerase sigma factor (TIGR02999 family)
LVADVPRSWENRGHFFAAAAEAMRRILVENARRKKRLKRGGDHHRVDLDDAVMSLQTSIPLDDLLSLDEALKRLEEWDKTKADLVKLRFFGGLTCEQAAKALGLSDSAADEHWAYARAWLRLEITEGMKSDLD